MLTHTLQYDYNVICNIYKFVVFAGKPLLG